tara:strand:- start:127247 stop:129715 length:2469 start_codon:yes stop_codon:yes gene_type:complete
VLTAQDSAFELPPFDWPATAPADFELGNDVVPTSYELNLDLPSSGAMYSGTVRVSVDVLNPVSTVWLHAVKFESISATVFQGRRKEVSKLAFRPTEEKMGLELSFPLSKGPALLELRFKGRPSNLGIFKRGTSYFTQFEPTFARRAFPCFDDPRFKTPWTLNLTVDHGMRAFGNAPMSKVQHVGARVRYSFSETPPLPSYLVAFAAGPLVAVAVDDPNRKMRIIGDKRRGKRLENIRRIAPTILSAIESYLDLTQPYAKQDLVSVPDFAYGGMENPGLISINESYVVAGPEFDDALKNLLAHEFAHLWFGDSVTMRWWDDVWLNESLAAWIAEKVAPSSWRQMHREWGMQLDALPGAQAVQQPSATPASLRESWFSGQRKIEVPRWIRKNSWTKGAAMLEMIEGLVGEQAMRRGLKLYLQRHADGVVTAQDFAQALSEGTHHDLRPIIKSFVTQTGLPMISASLECSEQVNRLTLSQEPYRLVGEATQDKLWQVPVCTSFLQGKKCFVLRERKASFELPSCPTLLHLDSESRGLYRYLMPKKAALEIAKNYAKQDPKELVSLAYALIAALKSGQAEIPHSLEVFGLLAKSENISVLRASLQGFQFVADLLPAPSSPSFIRLVAETWGPVAVRLQPIGHRLDDLRLAQDVIRFAGIEGRYGPLLEQANRNEKRHVIDSDDDAIRDIRILLQGLDESAPLTSSTVAAQLKMRPTRSRAFRWLVENYESTEGTWAFLVGDHPLRFLDYVRDAGGVKYVYGSGLCSEEEAAMLEKFASPRLLKIDGADRAKAQEVVSLNAVNIRRCAKLAAHHAADLRAFSQLQNE